MLKFVNLNVALLPLNSSGSLGQWGGGGARPGVWRPALVTQWQTPGDFRLYLSKAFSFLSPSPPGDLGPGQL